MNEVKREPDKGTRAKLRQFIADHKVGIWAGAIILVLAALFVFGVWRFGWEWTGFFRYATTTTTDAATGAVTQTHPGKTLWDLMGLLIIPLVLVVGGFLLNRAQRQNELDIAAEERETERQIAKDREEERALQGYLEAMTRLLLEEGLRTSDEDSEVRSIARARTLAVLGSLNGERKGSVLRFLYESNLIDTEKSVIALSNADLSRADLDGAYLSGAYLSGVDLSGAKLSLANLSGASLRGVNLNKANLRGAELTGADLAGAHLSGADLGGAYLGGAYLGGADLGRADLDGAYLGEAHLSLAKLNEANLREADLNGAELDRANLSRANLNGANLRGANLHRAYLRRADLSRAIYDKRTTWPEGFIPPPEAIYVDEEQG